MGFKSFNTAPLDANFFGCYGADTFQQSGIYREKKEEDVNLSRRTRIHLNESWAEQELRNTMNLKRRIQNKSSTVKAIRPVMWAIADGALSVAARQQLFSLSATPSRGHGSMLGGCSGLRWRVSPSPPPPWTTGESGAPPPADPMGEGDP